MIQNAYNNAKKSVKLKLKLIHTEKSGFAERSKILATDQKSNFVEPSK